MNIYISNLNYKTSSESLEQLFAEYGEVTSANVIKDRETGRSRGFAFVEMPNDTDAQKAIDELNGTDFEEKTLNVSVARPREDNGGGRFNRGGNSGGGYNKNRY